MLNTDLAWLAGIWDGEGSITIFSHTEKTGNTKLCPTCCVVNTDVNIVNKVRRILEELGCSFVLHEHKPKNKKHKLQWRLTTRNMTYIKIFLEAIIEYLVGDKKAKGEIVLSYVTQRLNKLETRSYNGTTTYDDEDWEYLSKIRSSQTTREAPLNR